jgi:hypothetical protein
MRIFLLLSVMLLSACAEAPVFSPPTAQDFGPYPDGYEMAIRTFMDKQLKDPGSATYAFIGQPKQTSLGDSTRYYGWGVCADINAKNSYGGYTGAQRTFFFLRNGEVDQYKSSSGTGGFTDGVVQGLCSRL